MVRQTSKVIILEILALLGVLAILALAGLAIRLSYGPIELNAFKGQIESTLERNRDGRRATLENVSLEWLAAERRVVVTATQLRFYNDADEIAAEADRAEILLDITDMFIGKARPVGLVLEDGWIGVHQSETGWSIAGDPIGTQKIVNADSETLRAEDMLVIINQALIDVLSVLRRDAGALPLERLTFKDVDLVMTQSDLGERARLTETAGGFVRDANGIKLDIRGRSTGEKGAPGTLSAKLDVPGNYDEINVDLSFNDWSLQSVANLFPATAETVTGLPSNLIVELNASGEAGLTRVAFQAAAGAGDVVYDEAVLPVQKASLSGEYFPATDQLDIKISDFDIGPASGDISFVIEDTLKADAKRRFTLESPALRLDLRPRFSDVWRPTRLKVSGLLDVAKRSADIETASLQVDEAKLRARGAVTFLRNTRGRDLPIETGLSLELTGVLQPDQLMWFWPVQQAPGARAYITRILKAGRMTGATAQINLKRDSFSEGHLADEAIDVNFAITDGRVKVLPDIPEMDGINAVGTMTGNSLRIKFEDAAIGGWAIKQGEVHYPQLSPPGANMNVRLEGSGPAEKLLRMVSDSRLQLQARSGLDPANISGDAEMAFTMSRPARPKVPLSEYRYSGEGTVRAGGLKNAFNGTALKDSDAHVFLDQNGIQIVGAGTIVNAPIDYDWSYKFGGTNTPSVLKATSLLTPDVLNAFDVTGRAYLTGEAPVEFEALLDGARLRAIDAAFDLLSARLDIAELNWVKPAGQAGNASLQYTLREGARTTAITLDSDGAAFDATFALAENGQLLSAIIERIFLENRLDMRGTATRTDTQTLQLAMSGSFLDLSRFLPGASALGSSTSGPAARFGDIVLDADIERLLLRDGFETKNMTLAMRSTKDGIQTLEAKGELLSGAGINAAYDASGLGDPTFLINSGDASFLASVFLGLDSLEGGTLQMSGTFATGDLPTQMRIVIENGRLKDAPFVTQILSLASLRGLSDTVSGDGVLFTEIEVPLTIDAGRYNIVGARASGPALGLTANGAITPTTGDIDVDGVLVPSFGLNSALGGIPIIGDLFVSRQGEGVISLRYSVKGTLEKAQVSVNPLSAITPGVLRRIFDNPAEAELPDGEEIIPGE